MKKWLTVFCFLGILLTAIPLSAAPAVEPLQTLDILADNNVNIFDYTFSSGEGQITLTELQNIWGGGAGMRVDINTDTGADQVLIEIAGAYNGDSKSNHMLSVSLQSTHQGLLTANVSRQTPLVLNISNGKLTIAAAGSKRVVDNVVSFGGKLSTQSITGKLNIYPATEVLNPALLLNLR